MTHDEYCTYVYFTYTHSTHEVEIKGTWVVG